MTTKMHTNTTFFDYIRVEAIPAKCVRIRKSKQPRIITEAEFTERLNAIQPR